MLETISNEDVLQLVEENRATINSMKGGNGLDMCYDTVTYETLLREGYCEKAQVEDNDTRCWMI